MVEFWIHSASEKVYRRASWTASSILSGTDLWICLIAMHCKHPFKKCVELELKGTILLSTEGINFFLAGSQTQIDGFVQYLERDERFVDIPLKVSYSDYQPFRRMNARLKKEIISLGLDHIKPAEFTGEEITPTEFKEWLDAEKEVLVLDTRNDYECRVGTL